MVPLVLTCKLLYCRVTLVLVLSCVHITDKTAAGKIGFEGETCMVPLVLTCKLLYCRVTLVLVLSCVHVTDKTAAGSKHTCRMEQSSLESER